MNNCGHIYEIFWGISLSHIMRIEGVNKILFATSFFQDHIVKFEDQSQTITEKSSQKNPGRGMKVDRMQMAISCILTFTTVVRDRPIPIYRYRYRYPQNPPYRTNTNTDISVSYDMIPIPGT